MSKHILSKPLIIGATATLLASGIGAYAWVQQDRPAVLEVYVFALKSGRSIFIRTPEDKRILIDGGSNSEVIAELTKILPFYSRRIDTVIVTNTEGKNVSGLIDVLNRYRVDRVFIPKLTLQNLHIASSTDQVYVSLLQTLDEMKVSVTEIVAGDLLKLGENVIGKILFPVPESVFDYSKASAPEVLVDVSFDSTSVLLLGSASIKVQKYLVSSGSLHHSDALIVSNNASASNLVFQVVDIMRPKFIVYSKIFSKTSTKSLSQKSKAPKKIPQDPLASILIENRFNLNEKGTVKIISDGKDISVK